MSLGWADNILLSMGPLGVMTIIVSAIRIGGARRLKALVGRARESSATAETELLTSTSEVCELWNGNAVVRTPGSANTSELALTVVRDQDVQCMIFDGAFRQVLQDTELLNLSSPNISLNLPNAKVSDAEAWSWACLRLVVQLCPLVFPAVATYQWGWTNDNFRVSRYGYPCFAAGTVLMSIGLLSCSRIIEGSTTEHELEVNAGRVESVRFLYIQKAVKIGDQNFDSYLMDCGRDKEKLTISKRNKKNYR